MKKVLSIVLALVMLLSLVACADGGKTTPSASPSGSAAPAESGAPAESSKPADASPSASSIGGVAEGEESVGWYSDPVDHFARDPYDIVYMAMSMSAMTANFSHGFEVWGERLNYNYSDYSANDDTDAFLTTVETYSVQGIDGFIFDFDDNCRERLLELTKELDLNYMSGMVSAKNDDGTLAHPSISFDMYQFGVDMWDYLYDASLKKWGDDVDFSKIGIIDVDFSAVYEIAQRQVGFLDTLKAKFPDIVATNYFVADTVAQGGLSAESAYNEVAPIIAAHPEFERWIVAGAVDDFGQGAARALEAAGKDDNAIVVCIGGETLIAEWDAGYEGCWVSAIYTAQMIYCEGIICGLIAMIDGRATAETLWPTHIAPGEKYAQIILQSVPIEHDTYTEYLEWVDAYTGYDWSHYDYKGTDFAYTLEFR